nr:hypothetical protein [Tanacetum cinerariifolium]
MQNQLTNLTDLLSKFVNSNNASTSSSGTLPSNTIANPRSDLNAITTRSGVSYDGPQIPPSTSFLPKKLRDKANDQREKFFQIFKDLNFNISFVDALILMPKFGPSIKSLLTNKDKLCELARTSLNEHCSAVLLKKLPEKLEDPELKKIIALLRLDVGSSVGRKCRCDDLKNCNSCPLCRQRSWDVTDVKKSYAQNFLDLKSSVGRLELLGKLDERTHPTLHLQREFQSREVDKRSQRHSVLKHDGYTIFRKTIKISGCCCLARLDLEVFPKAYEEWLIEADAAGSIPDDLSLRHTFKKIKVEYKCKPPYCLECHVFGHAADQCPKHVHEEPKPTIKTSDDGFTTVVNKRSIGNGVANSQRTNKGSFSGVRVNNPNKNFVYQPVKKASDQKPIEKEGNNVEKNNGVKLKNLFEKLNEITSIVDPIGDDGEAATFGDTNKKDNTDKDDSDSEVEKGLNRAPKQLEVRQVVNENQLNNLPSERRYLWSDLGMHKYVVRGFPWAILMWCLIWKTLSQGLHFTWNQKPKGGGGVLKKLDRIMGNINFIDTFPGAYAIFHPYRISDHLPAVLKLPTLTSPKPKPFKFFNFLAFKTRFIEVMESHWNTQIDGHNMFKVVSKMKLLKKPLRKLLHDQAFNEAKLDEERFLKQKAKVDWLEAGDTNSAYFHKTIKCRNQRSRTDSILNTNNVEVSGSLVPDVFVSHYEQFLGSSTDCNILNEEGLFSNNVPTDIASNMVRDVTNDEIKAAMFVICDDRAPSLDGRISDNILIVPELMHNYHRNWGSPRCAFKIDIQKAYDTVDWKFLENILIKFRFHNTMVKWIMACVSSTSFSLSINGNIHGFFKGKRVLRQGDPLSLIC